MSCARPESKFQLLGEPGLRTCERSPAKLVETGGYARRARKPSRWVLEGGEELVGAQGREPTKYSWKRGEA